MNDDHNGRSLPSITALRTFDAVCRSGSMSLAGRELNVTTGAISRQIKVLESELGVTLFRRGNSNAELTQIGEQLRNGVVPAFDRMESSCREARDVHGNSPLTVVCLSTFIILWFLPRLASFKEFDPDTEIRLISMDDRQIDWTNGNVDAVIDVGRWPVSLDLVQTSFMQDSPGLVASPEYWTEIAKNHPSDGTGSTTLPPNATLISIRTRPGLWSRWLDAAKIEAGEHKELWVDHLHIAIEAARLGLGLATAPMIYVKNDIEAGKLVAPLGFFEKPIPYYIAWPKRRSEDRRIKSLISWLKKEGRRT